MSGFGYLPGSVQKFAALYHRKSGITESVKVQSWAVVSGLTICSMNSGSTLSQTERVKTRNGYSKGRDSHRP